MKRREHDLAHLDAPSTCTIRALIEDATKAKLSPAQVCERLAKVERRERDARNLARRTRAATPGPLATLDAFDCGHPCGINRELYDRLLALDFMERGENVLLRGPSGVAKTTLAHTIATAT